MCFVIIDSDVPSGEYNSKLTQETIDLFSSNQPGMDPVSLKLCERWWDGWMKMV